MRYREPIVFILAVLSYAALAAAQSVTQPLTLDEAVHTALQRHPALKEAEAAVSAAEAQVREARSYYFPQLSFSAIGKVGLSGATNALGLPGFPASPFYRNTAYSVNWYQSVFDFGRIKHLVAMDRALYRSAQLRQTSEQQRIVLDVKQAYFSVLEAQQLERAGEVALRERSLAVEKARAYYEQDLGAQLELNHANASLAEAREALTHARNAVETAFVSLRVAMGIDGAQTYLLQVPPFEETAFPLLENLIGQAAQNRPDKQVLDFKIAALNENLEIARSQSLPDIRGFAAGGQGRFNGTQVKENQQHGVGALGVISPIFTGGRLKAVRDEARAEIQGATAVRQQLLEQIRLEVTEAYYQIADLDQQIKAAYQQKEFAEGARRLAQTRYRTQLASYLDLLIAQVASTNAEAEYVRVQLDYDRAKAQLDFATGRAVQP
jgi:outer membrane protein TolC